VAHSCATEGLAGNRYALKSAGIPTNYTVQAGDVLQIQNGVTIAIIWGRECYPQRAAFFSLMPSEAKR